MGQQEAVGIAMGALYELRKGEREGENNANAMYIYLGASIFLLSKFPKVKLCDFLGSCHVDLS